MTLKIECPVCACRKIAQKAYRVRYIEKNSEKERLRKVAWKQNNKGKVRAYTLKYYQKNKEKMLAYAKNYAKNHPGRRTRQRKEYKKRPEVRERIREQAKKYNRKNKERHRSWVKMHPDSVHAAKRRYYLKVRDTPAFKKQRAEYSARYQEKKRSKLKIVVKKCLICRDPFIGRHGQKYCSQKCVTVKNNALRKNEISLKNSVKRCLICRDLFTQKITARKMYCRSCYRKRVTGIENAAAKNLESGYIKNVLQQSLPGFLKRGDIPDTAVTLKRSIIKMKRLIRAQSVTA